MNNQTYKKYRKKAGKCPVCGTNLALSKEELFEHLGIDEQKVQEEGLTEQDVKRAYKEKAKTTHPDKGGTADDFQELREAKDELLEVIKEEEINPLDINPIGQALERNADETYQAPKPQLTQERYNSVIRAILNLRKARALNPQGPCPYCKKRPKRHRRGGQ